MNGDNCMMGVSVDSITMNLGKGTSMSSSELSVSINARLNLLFEEEAMRANYFLLVQCSTAHHGVQLEKGKNQGGNPFALAETGIQYQYTFAKSTILGLCQILLLITQQSNSAHKSYLSAQLILSKNSAKSKSSNSIKADCMIRSGENQTYVLGYVGTSRLVGSGPIRSLVRPSKVQSDVLQIIDHSVVGSMTAQPPGFRPSALLVAAHG